MSKILKTITGAILVIIFASGCAQNSKYQTNTDQTSSNRSESAATHLQAADNYLDKYEIDHAEQELETAMFLEPHVKGLHGVLTRFEHMKSAESLYSDAVEQIAQNQIDSAIVTLYELQEILPDYKNSSEILQECKTQKHRGKVNTNERISFDVQDMTIEDIFNSLAVYAEINLLIDDSVDKDVRLNIRMMDADIMDVMNSIAASNDLMIVSLNSGTYILSQDSKENRDRYSREDVQLFVLRYADAEEIRKLLEPVAGDSIVLADKRTNSVVVRTDSSKMGLVRELVTALDIRESEVMVEVEILEVTRSKVENLGMDLGDSPTVEASIAGTVKNSSDSGNLTLSNLKKLGSGQIFLNVPSLYLNLIKRDSRTRTLAQPKLRILNRVPARLHIGEQVPIKITSSLFRDSSEELSSYEYRDVGIVMNMTPRILSQTELALDLKLEVSSILETSEDGHPLIGTREVETTLRMKDGQVEMIAGLLKDEERTGTAKIPLLGDIPVLGKLFASTDENINQTDIIISITPHIADRRKMYQSEYPIWKGSKEQKNNSPLKSDPHSADNASKGVIFGENNSDSSLDGDLDSDNGDDPRQEAEETIATVFFSTQNIALNPGKSDVVTVEIANAVNVGSVPFYIDYDPNLIEIMSIKEGAFLGQDGSPTAFMHSNNSQRGRVIIGLSRVGNVGGANGSGALIHLEIKASKEGSSPLAFTHENVMSPTADIIPARFSDGRVVIKSGK